MTLCPNCRQETEPGAPACPLCGASLAAGGPPPPPPPEPPAGQGQGGPGPQPTAEDWRAFIGPNAEAYLPTFARFSPGGREEFVATWHWPAFLASFWWFLYRKLYLWFGLCLAGMFVPYVRWAVWIGAALAANYLYFIEAQRQIRAIKAANPPGQQAARLAQAGGVHQWVPWVAVAVSLGLLLLVMVVLMFLGILTLGWFMALANFR